MLRESRSRSCSSPVRPASAFARSPVTAITTSWTAWRRSTGRRADPLPFDSECYARAAKTIYAVLVLAHESYHTAGVADEAAANCFAIQAMAWTAIQLGAAAGEAELLARAMEALEPSQGGEYGTAECHAGRELDLHPETPAFPTEHPVAPPLGRGGAPSLVGRA